MVNLLYQRFGAIFMSIHRFAKLFCLKNQAFPPVLLVGKLSKLLKILGDYFTGEYLDKNQMLDSAWSHTFRE